MAALFYNLLLIQVTYARFPNSEYGAGENTRQ